MLSAQSPISGNQIQRPRSGRIPLQPKNTPANPLTTEILKPKPDPRIEISVVENSNKENQTVYGPLLPEAQEKGKPIGDGDFEICTDSSLAEELSAIRERMERLRIDKQRTEKMLRDRDSALDLQMQELMNRGELQKQLEIEVDRLFRLKELRLSCMRISSIQSLRDKEKDKKGKEDEFKGMMEIDEEEGTMLGGNAPSSPSSDLDYEK